MNSKLTGLVVCGVLVVSLLTGCAHGVHYYKETGPSTEMSWESPTAKVVCANYQPVPLRTRDWEETTIAPRSGAVYHYPLYFEDPFMDKGDGRTDATDPHNVYRLGWEDWVAFPYGIARFTANWLMFPVSVIVTPPCTTMVSDGEISRQLVFCDHDATRERWIYCPCPCGCGK